MILVMDVDIHELEAQLSHFIDRAERGERIRVMEQGRPKVIIGPVIDTRTRIEQGIREGWIRPGNGQPLKPLKRGFKAKRSLQEMLDEDRGD